VKGGTVIWFSLVYGWLFCPLHVCGQQAGRLDSINFGKLHLTHNKFINNIFQQAVNSVRRDPGLNSNYLIGRSEDPYLPYQGKIIRHIFVEPFGFNRSFSDTSVRDNSFATRVATRFHKTTYRFIVRENLFIQPNTPLNAYKVADNERYIRSLDYMQDARIIVDTLAGNPDSVDLTVYTKDLFSIAGGAASDGLNHINANLYDANLAGLAQKVEVTGLYDYNRHANFGYGGYYRKDNVLHSFLDATVGYSQMNTYSFTHQEESAQYIMLSRPLVSPYTHLAGALTLSHNENYNLYHVPDSLLYRYKYDLVDAWAGYNVAINKLTATNNSIRDRRFFAIRYFERNYKEVPAQVGTRFDPIYNTTHALLGQFTFFRQDYFKTQYIYGFGTTEDLPYGYNLAVTAGWYRQLHLERPYAGISGSEYIATNKGDFIQVYLRSGGFLYKNKIQDGSFLVGATVFSRLIFWNSTKIRQYVNASYSQLFDRTTYAPLKLDSYYGLRGFLSDSVYGTQRVSVQLETEFYLRYRLLGFQFAPFPYCDIALITPENAPYRNSLLYTSLGGGIRARNENLVFETIELRAYFFPVAPSNMKGFKVIINSNIRFRYSSNYITPPDVVQMN
jgi:hypothetical protein